MKKMNFSHDHIVPDIESEKDKQTQVSDMFNHIAKGYDLMNTWLTFGIDKIWRKRMITIIKKSNAKIVLDAATGTGDIAFLLHKKLALQQIVAIDASKEMLKIAQHKKEKKNIKAIIFEEQDCSHISYPDEYFEAVTIAFGVRNFADLKKGLSELYRVLKKDSPITILEFSRPSNPLITTIYSFYMQRIAPLWGQLFTKNKKAYQYLFRSAIAFPEGENFLQVLREIGFLQVKQKRMTFGICTIYIGIK